MKTPDARYEELRETTIRQLIDDPWYAHQALFSHRHPSPSSRIHYEFVTDFWADRRYSQVLAFRGSAKSTYGEEDIALAAVYAIYRNILIVGSSEARAAERLTSVAYELKNNEKIEKLFGPQDGTTWTQTKLVLKGNNCVQAMGRDQDIRGIKHLEWRPDFIFVDDFEDKDNVQSPEGRAKTLRWLLSELLPACAPNRRVRVRATPMDAESVPMMLKKAGWHTSTYPIEYPDVATGQRKAAWPAVFPLDWIDREVALYRRLGEMAVWNREMMCDPQAESDRTFTRDMKKVEPRPRTWQAIYSMHDPARTRGANSAATGIAAWSWIRNRLHVWRADAKMLLPDEIIADIFATHDALNPVWVGVEEDGLNEWLNQPLRQEQLKRGITIPLRPVRAPRGKMDFIRGLQPFFKAGEVTFEDEATEFWDELMAFPRGRIDGPNALAYALLLRPGMAVYPEFDEDMIEEDLRPLPNVPLFLAANSDGAVVTAVLMQRHQGEIRILADFVREGNPSEVVADIHAEARLAGDATFSGTRTIYGEGRDVFKLPLIVQSVTRTAIRWIIPPWHMEVYRNVGLAAAIRQLPQAVSQGAGSAQGRAALAGMLERLHLGRRRVIVSSDAHWTLRAFAGGYARRLDGRGLADAEPEDGLYRVLMEGVESFVAVGQAMDETEESRQPVAYDKRGVPYASAMPARR